MRTYGRNDTNNIPSPTSQHILLIDSNFNLGVVILISTMTMKIIADFTEKNIVFSPNEESLKYQPNTSKTKQHVL
jgi:hypothetical protein